VDPRYWNLSTELSSWLPIWMFGGESVFCPITSDLIVSPNSSHARVERSISFWSASAVGLPEPHHRQRGSRWWWHVWPWSWPTAWLGCTACHRIVCVGRRGIISLKELSYIFHINR
jgi:hypothetical protein